MPELVCTSAEEYVDRAVSLGTSPGELQSLRERLRAGRDSCTLFDMPLLVHRLEDLYQEMWSQHESGALPSPDLANLDVYFEVGCSATQEDMEVQMIKDYRGWWMENLARRHKFRRVNCDSRLVTAPDLLR